MANHDESVLPPPSPEHRKVALGQFEHAYKVLATGNHDYAIQLLLTCCKLDPANLIYRKALRQTEKTKYKNNMRGSRLAVISTSTWKAKIKAAKTGRDYLKVLEYGEEVLTRNPWDTGAQMDMADGAECLGLLDLAVWLLEQARQKDPRDVAVNRSLARLYERRGNFAQAIQLWDLVRRVAPNDLEAQHKAKDLAAEETIARGQYHATIGKATAKAGEAAEGEAEAPAEPVRSRPVLDRVGQEAAAVRTRIEANPTNANGWLQLASIYHRADRFDEAKAALEEGLAATGNNFEIALTLAELEIEPFRRNLAIAEGKLKAHPGDEEVRKLRIRLLKEINTRELDLYRQKASRYPNELEHRLELGVRLLRAGQLDEAIRELQAARSDSRHKWKALLYLGYCFKNRHNWRLAERNFEESLQALPPAEEATRKELLFQLAQGSAEAGDVAKAVELGLELANIDFAFRDIGRLLDEWQQRLAGGPSAVGSGTETD